MKRLIIHFLSLDFDRSEFVLRFDIVRLILACITCSRALFTRQLDRYWPTGGRVVRTERRRPHLIIRMTRRVDYLGKVNLYSARPVALSQNVLDLAGKILEKKG